MSGLAACVDTLNRLIGMLTEGPSPELTAQQGAELMGLLHRAAPKAEERPRCVAVPVAGSDPRVFTCGTCFQQWSLHHDEPPICPGPEKPKARVFIQDEPCKCGHRRGLHVNNSGLCDDWIRCGCYHFQPVEAAPVEPPNVYGMPLDQVPIPEGWERVDARRPKSGEWYLASYGDFAAIEQGLFGTPLSMEYNWGHRDDGPRIIVRKTQPEPPKPEPRKQWPRHYIVSVSNRKDGIHMCRKWSDAYMQVETLGGCVFSVREAQPDAPHRISRETFEKMWIAFLEHWNQIGDVPGASRRAAIIALLREGNIEVESSCEQ